MTRASELDDRSGGPSRAEVYFLNNSLEGYTVASSGAIATHVAATRAAAERDGFHPLVVTRAPHTAALDHGPRRDVPARSNPKPVLARRVLDKSARTLGFQQYLGLTYTLDIRRVLVTARPPAVLVAHNDPDIADWLAVRFPKHTIVHVWHNLLPHGRAVNRRVIHMAVSEWLSGALFEAGSVRKPPTIVPNGVDVRQFRPRQAHERDNQPLTISFLGRTGREKGLDILLRALRSIVPPRDGLRLLVMGSNTWGPVVEDDYQRVLRQGMDMLAAQGVEVVTTGHLGRSEVAQALRRSDLHVVPSRWQDPAPLVLMEAMATGLPTIAARSGGMPEYGRDACSWFEREDADGLAAALQPLVADPAVRAVRGAAARRRAEELGWERTWRALARAAGLAAP